MRLLNPLLTYLIALLIGEAQTWLPELIERASQLKTSGGFEDGADLCVTFLTSVYGLTRDVVAPSFPQQASREL